MSSVIGQSPVQGDPMLCALGCKGKKWGIGAVEENTSWRNFTSRKRELATGYGAFICA